MMQLFIGFLFWLAVSHAVCDMGLQPERLSRMKYRRQPEGQGGRWMLGLTCHALIHAGGVALVTGSVALGLLEFLAHWAIDAGKGEGWYGIKLDQALHATCKVLWAGAAIAMVPG
jgi:hypothetical protein